MFSSIWGTDFDRQSGISSVTNFFHNSHLEGFTDGTSGTTTGADYIMDLARLTAGGSASINWARQSFSLGQTDVPGNPEHYLRLTRTAAGSSDTTLALFIEELLGLSGAGITFHTYMRAQSVFNWRAQTRQMFGTGGSPSAAVASPLQTIGLTTNWQKIDKLFALGSTLNKVLGSGGDHHVNVELNWPAAEGPTQWTDICMIHVNAGDTRDFEVEDWGYDKNASLKRRKRMVRTTYNPGVVPGAVTAVGAIIARANGTGASPPAIDERIDFDEEMWIEPTGNLWSSTGVANTFRDIDNNLSRDMALVSIGKKSARLQNTGTVSDGARHEGHVRFRCGWT